MARLRQSLVFIDTGFLKKYRMKDNAYEKLFQYAKNNEIIICTSLIVLEEWRTQKVSHLTSYVGGLEGKLTHHCEDNLFSNILVGNEVFSELRYLDNIKDESKKVVADFIKENNIECFYPIEPHIENTWNSYFEGALPFKNPKNRKDIPDAWIFEAAKDALEEHSEIPQDNLFCLSGDGTMNASLESLNFQPKELVDLIELFTAEEEGEELPSQDLCNQNDQQPQLEPADEGSPLDRLLSKSLNNSMSDIMLRLLGYLPALNSPSHELLIQNVSMKGFNEEEVKACATILSSSTKEYIKNTGGHYLVGNSMICAQAAERVQDEIIAMLDEE